MEWQACIMGTMTDRTNAEWLADLRGGDAAREAALSDLRAIIRQGLSYALSRWLSPSDPHFDSLADEVTQETLLRVLDQLETFEGRSRFTTWVHKIAIRIALSELRRKRWRDASLDHLLDDEDTVAPLGLIADPVAGPETVAERSDALTHVRRIIAEELTPRQRQALVAVGVHGMPMEEVARRMETNRNALYKLLHDARLRLRRRMEQEGLSPGEVLALFER